METPKIIELYEKMDTHFASPKRSTEEQLAAEIDFVSQNSVMTGLLHSVSGLLAVLDENRQIIALNDSLMKTLGIDDPKEALGLRPGEVLECIYKGEEPAGCGTTKYCSSCGAAIAIVSSLGQDQPMERICALSAKKNGKLVDMVLNVRSYPIKIDGIRFLLLFLQDITKQQQGAALERTFYHDINNILALLVGSSEILLDEEPSELANTIHQISLRLIKEVEMQRSLSKNDSSVYQPAWEEISMGQLFKKLQSFFANHPAARGKKIKYATDDLEIFIKTDYSLMLRVLCNMVINALEATHPNREIKCWIAKDKKLVAFCVWNDGKIPPDVSRRIFQKNFSTKKEMGRGIGTFSMKFFGEKILGGKISFTSTKKEGTEFRFALPMGKIKIY